MNSTRASHQAQSAIPRPIGGALSQAPRGRTRPHFANALCSTAICAWLTGCGGGGGSGGDEVTATGVFKDSNVSGVTYQSGSRTSVTDVGRFTYVVGQPVTFSIGNVVLGSVAGQSLITPLDLVAGANTGTTRVLNITRLLMLLDSDGDPLNGIDIAPTVAFAATNWPSIDLASTNIAAQLTPIIASVSAITGRSHVLPSAANARSHLEATLRCARSGAFRGGFAGTDSGPFGVLVNAQTGLVGGFAFSRTDGQLLALAGSVASSFDQTGSFVTGQASSGATFSGRFTSADQIEGNWSLAPDSGTFSGARVGGLAGALYRFTGVFAGGAAGVFTFDVDAQNNVTGVAHTVTSTRQAGQEVNQVVALSGTLVGTTLMATTSGGDGTITGTLNRTTGALVGTWVDLSGNSGSFAGSGCRLN